MKAKFSLSPVLLLALVGCASAGDHLSDGVRLQREGRHMDAAHRYVDALEKDGALTEARERLVLIGDSAIGWALDGAATHEAAEDAFAAAGLYREVDRIVDRARGVEVRLSPPVDFGDRKRATYDWAIESSMEDALRFAGEARFGEAHAALVRARSAAYEPSPEQRARVIGEELELLLAWGTSEVDRERFRSGFERAAQAVELAPDNRWVADRAQRIQRRAVELGTLRLAVLPFSTLPSVGETVGTSYADELSDNLELDHWRSPPPFLAVADPAGVRRWVREIGAGSKPLSAREVARVLDLAGAHMGALIEIKRVDARESDVRQEAREARSRRGGPGEYQVERGRLTIEVEAEVILVDARGREVERFTERASGSGRFERGVFRGNPADLELSRSEARYFDRDVIEGQRAEVRSSALADLAEYVGRRTLSAALSRVR